MKNLKLFKILPWPTYDIDSTTPLIGGDLSFIRVRRFFPGDGLNLEKTGVGKIGFSHLSGKNTLYWLTALFAAAQAKPIFPTPVFLRFKPPPEKT